MRLDALGVKVATVFAAFMATVPGTFPVFSLSVKVRSVPAGDESIVAGSIGWLKVATTSVPVTTLLLLLVLVGTFVAPLPGLSDTTVGLPVDVVRLPEESATTVLFAAWLSVELPPAPPPHPANEAASSDATIHASGLDKFSNPFIFFFLYVCPQGAGEWLPPCGYGH